MHNLTMDEKLKASIEKLRRKFPHKPKSWIRRSALRFLRGDVKRINNNTWVVIGEPKLGDTLPQYIVMHAGRKYTCDCQRTTWGHRRQPCTHRCRNTKHNIRRESRTQTHTERPIVNDTALITPTTKAPPARHSRG